MFWNAVRRAGLTAPLVLSGCVATKKDIASTIERVEQVGQNAVHNVTNEIWPWVLTVITLGCTAFIVGGLLIKYKVRVENAHQLEKFKNGG